MKKLSSLFTGLRTNTLGIVVLMITLMGAQQVRSSQSMINWEQEIAASMSDDGEDQVPETTFNIDHSLIASNAQFHVNHVFYEIMNIEQDEEEDNFENSGSDPISDDQRKLLFNQVISPNAP